MRDDVDVDDVTHVTYLYDQSKDVIGCCSQVVSNQSNQIAPTQTNLMSLWHRNKNWIFFFIQNHLLRLNKKLIQKSLFLEICGREGGRTTHTRPPMERGVRPEQRRIIYLKDMSLQSNRTIEEKKCVKYCFLSDQLSFPTSSSCCVLCLLIKNLWTC